ncbi:helix-turn-helix domain-containing protein [Rhodococcus sp. NPDC058514]|uniref:helix-turn-helix domain-containing protein n=1 Tax=unclassified Rhodococcus (in: high G+C Gram-positive bacteria) TaxID=192944 RepID=UPI003660FC32
MADQELHRAAFDAAERRGSIAEAAAELGCSESTVRRMADQYRRDADERAAREQYSLFEV